MSNTSSTRTTLASTNARIDEMFLLVGRLTEGVVALTDAVAQYTTPAQVVTAITDAPSKRPAAKKTAAKKATAKKAPAKASVPVVTIAQARQAVADGANAWTVKVASATTGEPIPFGLVLRAEKAAARADAKAGTTATKAATKAPSKALKAVGTSASVYFGMSKTDLVADGSKGALAEIARRAAKHAKTA